MKLTFFTSLGKCNDVTCVTDNIFWVAVVLHVNCFLSYACVVSENKAKKI